MRPPEQDTLSLLERARAGDRAALEELLARHRDYVRRVVDLRMDRRLRSRLDPSDVIQEAFLDAVREFERYAESPPLPFHLWLRQKACDRLATATRYHLGAECRDASREVPLPDHSSLLLARGFQPVAGDTPLRKLMAREQADLVRQSLGRLAGQDAEIILLRKLEGMSNQEAAEVLGIEPAAASKRFARALLRLEEVLRQMFPQEPPT